MRLFAAMCNQPQRLLDALAPARAALVAAAPVARWGLGYVQSGEVLLARTPRPSARPIDFFSAIEGVNSDCVLGHAVPDVRPGQQDDGPGGTDDTPPFRYRRWMYIQDGPNTTEGAWDAIASQVPDYLRRNIKGRGTAELAFYVVLAMMHDLGGIDDANMHTATTRKALAAASALVAGELTKIGVTTPLGNFAVSNGRSMLVARLSNPLWLRRLHVNTERGERDQAFKGVLLISSSSSDAEPGEGFEEIPIGSVVSVTRDLRVDVLPLAS